MLKEGEFQMFCEKNKLQALTRFCSTDNTRMALRNVRFEGENAIATNGHVLAIATFKQDADIGIDSPVKSDDKPFSVSVESILKATKNTSKKSPFLHTQGVFVAKNTAASFSDVKNCAKYHEEVDQNYPNFKQVIPEKTPNDSVLSLGKEPLVTLVEAMKNCGCNQLTMRIPPMSNKGYVNGAVHFAMHGNNDDSGITGIVMPFTPQEGEQNSDHVLILQEDISEMLDLLCVLQPEDERVKYFAEKYSKLASTTESLAA